MHVYVEKIEDQWVVKREGSDEILAAHYRKQRAIESAKEIALGQDAELIVLRKDGTIDNLNEHGIDPFPSPNNSPEYREDDSEM